MDERPQYQIDEDCLYCTQGVHIRSCCTACGRCSEDLTREGVCLDCHIVEVDDYPLEEAGYGSQ